MKKIFYFIIALISIYCISCKRGQIENKNVFLDSDSTFLESDSETDSEFDWDKYYDSLPDSILEYGQNKRLVLPMPILYKR